MCISAPADSAGLRTLDIKSPPKTKTDHRDKHRIDREALQRLRLRKRL